MKPADRMKIAHVLNRNAERHAEFKATVKVAKEILGEDKVKVISDYPGKKEKHK